MCLTATVVIAACSQTVASSGDAGVGAGVGGQGTPPPPHEGTGGLTGGAAGAGGPGGGGIDTGAGGAGDAGRIIDARAARDASDSGALPSDAGAGNDADGTLVSIFNGSTLDGWIQVPPSSWSVVGGAMHSLGTARGFIYTRATYQDFRVVFTSRLVADPAAHLPCVLFWGNAPAVDALAGIQVQPPRGYMWDYRRSGPTANMSPDRYETRLGGPALVDTQWSQCELLTNRAAGTMRFACCQLTGTATRCKGVEIVDFKDPTAGLEAPLAFQVHNAGMIEEFKDISIESPVAAPNSLVTTQWP